MIEEEKETLPLKIRGKMKQIQLRRALTESSIRAINKEYPGCQKK
jgi:hypothetical protein